MKHLRFPSAAAILIVAISVHAQSNNPPTGTPRLFHGEVSDSQCALNVHSLTRSHQEMLKSKSMGGTAATCSQYCIEHLGGDLVLVSGKDGRDVYHLDRPDLVHGFEGQKVKVNGVLDSKNSHLHVLKIDLEGQP
ncbi:MAG: hypothetical protein WB729_25200 [Candidatus Sulfotelmatobacter sp.]